MAITRPRGTNDFLPADTAKWQIVESMLHEICRQFGYGEIRTPIFEETELFQRGVGGTTDIVQKEMYTFCDQGERSLTLRPENTASAARAYLENKLYGQTQPVKLYYMGPMFRYERPQAGRFRQFHQFGVEVFGTQSPLADAEVIALAWKFYNRLGIRNMSLHLNSVGCADCRREYRRILQSYLQDKYDELCTSCQQRFERNPLRILDCKSPVCRELSHDAPTMFDNLCGVCADHFTKVRSALERADIPYTLDKRLVRGLDYYTKTAFEILVESIGAQSAICGGGRYDGLIEELGGSEPVPGVGFALGMERIFAALKAQGSDIEAQQAPDVFIVTAPGNDEVYNTAFALAIALRGAGLRVEQDLMGKSMKAQFKLADKLGAPAVVILGEEELADGQALVRNMQTSEQQRLSLAEIKEYLIER
ncbi:MAG: histidine--tRNA ligase [Bacillota bacterium]|jgi:histidyl-tRNA synthetase